MDQATFAPCTPLGVIKLIESIGCEIKGKRAVVVGRSNIVGKPTAMLLMHRHATVTICHSRTQNLPGVVREADILIAAIGRPKFIKGDWIKPGAVVIDVGINRLDDKTLVGDVDFEEAKEVAGWITPVPGGVGPMTIAMLLHNTLLAAKMTIRS
jgi:methylenetetrahydrofolate dehydrogenase (NADP+)/methenyltetrahydrofolate cyclohydrolase